MSPIEIRVMASNRLQIAMKRLTCCNILGSGFPSGIKVSFDNIVSEILSDYTLIYKITIACVQ